MRKLLKNRRAVSPVVSAVVMILVVMIAMSALFAFFVSYAASFQMGSGSAVLEFMTIEDVKFSDNRADIWIYNVGKVNFTIASVYKDGLLVSSFPPPSIVVYKNADITLRSHGKIREGAHAEITVYTTFATGTTYHFKIVTERGTSFEGDFTR